MPGKPKRAAKKSSPIPTKSEVEADEDLDEMDADELALIFPSSLYQVSQPKFAEN